MSQRLANNSLPMIPSVPFFRPRFRHLARGDDRLYFDEAMILRTAREQGPSHPLILMCMRTIYRELMLRYRRRINIRRRHNDDARAAYRRLDLDDFRTINARQAWANWRIIPRNLSGQLPRRPIVALDLCCGAGDSTAVLAYYCASGSTIVGLDCSRDLLVAARSRSYPCHHGVASSVVFHEQSVLDTFCNAQNIPYSAGSVDLINSVGAFGCHFDRNTTRIVAAECRRVLREGGLAMLDSGPDGTTGEALTSIFTKAGFELVGQARSSPLDRFTQICFRKAATSNNRALATR
jgi:ubiquinone/menaquinone biosynthesis C-methylase UbiE